MDAKQVPLRELLASVPADARLVIDDADGKGTRSIPVGRLCQEAAAALVEPEYPLGRATTDVGVPVYVLKKAEPVQEPVWVCPDSAEHRYGKPGHCEDCGKTLVQVAEPTTEESSAVEPVAWMVYTEGGTSAYVTDNPNDLVGAYRALALYTSPPK